MPQHCQCRRLPPMPPLASYFSQDELRSMSKQEWMEKYGGVLQSEQWFEGKSPAWNYDQDSWCVFRRLWCFPFSLVCVGGLGLFGM